MVFEKTISLHTSGHGDVHEITSRVQDVVSDSGVSAGLVNVSNVGSTAAISTLECEPGLEADLPAILNKLIPPGTDYGHEQAWHDGNAHSHLQATLLGPSVTLPVHKGQIVLGTWQQIFHLECDVKSRTRNIIVTVIGE